MLGYLSLDIICSSKLTVFLELRSLKTVRFSEQIMSKDKYPSIFFAPHEGYGLFIYTFCKKLYIGETGRRLGDRFANTLAFLRKMTRSRHFGTIQAIFLWKRKDLMRRVFRNKTFRLAMYVETY